MKEGVRSTRALQPAVSTMAPMSPAQTDLWLFLLWTMDTFPSSSRPGQVGHYAGDEYGRASPPASWAASRPYWHDHATAD